MTPFARAGESVPHQGGSPHAPESRTQKPVLYERGTQGPHRTGGQYTGSKTDCMKEREEEKTDDSDF